MVVQEPRALPHDTAPERSTASVAGSVLRPGLWERNWIKRKMKCVWGLEIRKDLSVEWLFHQAIKARQGPGGIEEGTGLHNIHTIKSLRCTP